MADPMTPTESNLSKPRRLRILLALGWYSQAIHHGVAQYARSAGWVLNAETVRCNHAPAGWKGQGIIALLGANGEMDRFVISAGVPVVNIGPVPKHGFPLVRPDNEAIGRMGAEHFLERGYIHLAFYIRTGAPAELQRLRGFRERVADSGSYLYLIDWTAPRMAGKSQAPSQHEWLFNELKSLPKPLAVMADYDDHAIEVIDACLDAGLPVPEQVAVLGVDNDILQCELAQVTLSSVDNNEEAQGYRAAELLGSLLRGAPPPAAPVIVPPRALVVRHSTDILAVEHPQVAAALRLIWTHYTEPITAQKVAAGIPMSSRRLHDAFVKHIGHTIAAELARKRVEHAQTLLAKTDKKTLEIATLCGFSSELQLRKVFKRALKTTPMAYRKTHRNPHSKPRGQD